MTVNGLNGLALRIAKEQKLRVWIDKECEIASSCRNEGLDWATLTLDHVSPANAILVPSFHFFGCLHSQ